MNNKKVIPVFILVFSLFLVSGCFDQGVTYQEYPTKISYTISYGYRLSCSGTGDYTVLYDCDIPEVLSGQASIVEVLNPDYENVTLVSFNNMKRWNISKDTCMDLELGLTGSVTADVYVESDLTGSNAWNIEKIISEKTSLIRQYCQAQANDTTTFIDPNDLEIKTIAESIYKDSDTNNSFLVAKEIFKWLKDHTTYELNDENTNVKTCIKTLDDEVGDCDDLSFLYIALCRAVNIPARFVRGFLVEEDHATPHAWVEVYVGEVYGSNNGWVPVECAGTATGKNKIESEINQNFGVESANHLRLFVDDGTNESMKISLIGISVSSTKTVNFEKIDFFAEISNYQVLENSRLTVDENSIRSYK